MAAGVAERDRRRDATTAPPTIVRSSGTPLASRIVSTSPFSFRGCCFGGGVVGCADRGVPGSGVGGGPSAFGGTQDRGRSHPRSRQARSPAGHVGNTRQFGLPVPHHVRA